MPKTYEPISTTTLGGTASTITFSSIPSTYTDLKLVILGLMAGTGTFPTLRLNNDSGTNYSTTSFWADGANPGSSRTNNYSYFELGGEMYGASTTIPLFVTVDILSYTGSTRKTILGTHTNNINATGDVGFRVGLWRNTSAVNRIDIISSSGNFNTGLTATLYGILKA